MLDVNKLFELPYRQLEKFPNKSMFVTKKGGVWVPLSTKSFVDEMNIVSKGLLAMGIQVGDKIGIISENRYEWNLLDLAAQQIGAIVVPVYPNISSKDYVYIFNDASIKLGVVGSESLYKTISDLRAQIPSLEHFFCFDKVIDIPHWKHIHDQASDGDASEIEKIKNAINPKEMVTIIYTSGTTGNPKGVMLSHYNILSNVEGCLPRIPADNESRMLSFLPVCHIYERTLHYLYMYLGSSIHFAESMDTIGDNIREIKPHVFTAVPRLLEKVYDKIMAKGEELTGIKRALFFWAVSVGNKYDVIGKSLWYKIKLFIARKLIFSKWLDALGGEIKAVASGSAALQPRLARIFLAAGVPVFEGYGLTETSPVISVNSFAHGIRIGSVGPVLENVEAKIAEDGEILAKGPNVMLGYYNLPDKTKEVIDEDGWFHTGDIGKIVEGRFLKITDRKKEIFKTSGGKYIVPQPMENKFKESRFIEQIMVIGEGEKFPSAFIVPAFEFIKEWAAKNKISINTESTKSIAQSEEVFKVIKKEVSLLNENYGSWEKIKRFVLMDREFTIENGELTPTLKFKRKVILDKYKDRYNEIYT